MDCTLLLSSSLFRLQRQAILPLTKQNSKKMVSRPGGNPRFLPAVKPCWVCLPYQHKSVDHSSAEHGLPGTGNDVLC